MGGKAKGQEMLASQLAFVLWGNCPLSTLWLEQNLPTETALITQLHIHGEMGWSPMGRPNLIILQGPPDGARGRAKFCLAL